MAPGDLNLKKSWHPALMKNQEKVWKKEQEALAERKKIQERQREIAKEKELSELRALQCNKTGKAPIDRVDWIYDDASSASHNGKMITSESEEYLLGKKRVDSLILDGVQAQERKFGFEKLQADMQLSERDEQIKSRDDPLQKIKEQQNKRLEQLQYQKSSKKEKYRDREKRHEGNSSMHDSQRSHGSGSSRYRHARERDTYVKYQDRESRLRDHERELCRIQHGEIQRNDKKYDDKSRYKPHISHSGKQRDNW